MSHVFWINTSLSSTSLEKAANGCLPLELLQGTVAQTMIKDSQSTWFKARIFWFLAINEG